MSANEYIVINGKRYAAIVPVSYKADNTPNLDSKDNPAVNTTVANGLVSYRWTSADATDAPVATDLADFTVGLASDGVAAGVVYHVIGGAWVSTGATVTNLYGG